MKKAILIFTLGTLIILPLANVSAFSTDYRYTGKPLDSSTNLYYYGQRYYDPNVGRFTQPDPVSNYLTNPQKLKQSTGQDLQKFLENPQALNSYSYTVNNPVRYTDPTGEWWKEFFTGKQSLSSLYGEIGEASMYVNPVMSTVIDHPYISGAAIGLITGLGVVIAGVAAGTAPWSLGTIGATTASTATVLSVPTLNVGQEMGKLNSVSSGAYQIAQSGGKNLQMIQNAIKNNMTINQVQKSINSLEQNAMEHLGRIKDPSTYKDYVQYLQKTAQEQLYTLQNWQKQAEGFMEQANVWKGYLQSLIDKN